ncbi:MFS transporter [Streptomyces sp. 8K308]|uniref:MFS transporter n=1 Tax=Streptomyces sp. 8K308 TaxID=2530388 RepID=UPI001FB6F648|nr:MFS transporter [Streptomyces sp. 8K308]
MRPATPAPRPSSLSTLGLLIVLLGTALPQLDFFIVNVALPTIDRDLNAGPALLELVVAGYGVGYAVLLVLGGRLGDTFGRRRLFMVGLAGFGLTSLACGLAPDAWSLVAARVAQAATAALMAPQTLATIQATMTGERRARAMSVFGAAAGLAMVTGQILGGLLVWADLAGTGWRLVFLLNVPVVLAGLWLARRVPETRTERPATVDVPGTVLLTVALVSLLLPLTEGRATGWPLWTWVSLAVAPAAAVAFFVVERRAERSWARVPLVPPSLLRLAGMRRALPLLALCVAGFGGFMFAMAVAFQDGLAFSPVRAGVALAPYAVAFLVASLLGPRLAARPGGARLVVTAGAAAQAVGIGVLALTVWVGWPDLGLLALTPGLLVSGFGQGLQMPTLMRLVLADVPAERAGVAGGVLTTATQSGIALGVALLGALFLALVDSAGMGDALTATLCAQLAAVLAVLALSPRLPNG